jgi:hypothetical protein
MKDFARQSVGNLDFRIMIEIMCGWLYSFNTCKCRVGVKADPVFFDKFILNSIPVDTHFLRTDLH